MQKRKKTYLVREFTLYCMEDSKVRWLPRIHVLRSLRPLLMLPSHELIIKTKPLKE